MARSSPEFSALPSLPAYGTFPWPFNNPEAENNESEQSASLQAICWAIDAGCRHLDTAFAYGNQEEIGIAMQRSGLPRRAFRVTSKLHVNNNSYQEARGKIAEAIEIIHGELYPPVEQYLDAFLIHYPGKGDIVETWRALLEARDLGLVRQVGVSNFEIWHLQKIHDMQGAYPEINQIEFHPWIFSEQVSVLRYCHDAGIAVEGYSPLAQGLRSSDMLERIAVIHRTTVARVLLKWSMQHGVLPVVGSRNRVHLESNFEPYGFDLSTTEMEEIDEMGKVQPLRIAEQWNWNSKKATFGGSPSLYRVLWGKLRRKK